MTQNKTKPTRVKVSDFIKQVEDPLKRKDCQVLMRLMREITGKNAKMWGSTIVGFGEYHYHYASGREGDSMITGFSPRKAALSIYIMSGFDREVDLMKRLGKFKTGRSCLYVKRLDDIDQSVLAELIESSVKYMRDKYPCK